VKNTFRSTSQFWTEIAASAGLIGTLATASSCLTTQQIARAQKINDFGVANSYWKSAMINEFIYLLKESMTRFPGAAD
jgi:hypothetical protein